jgi:hypothetical protein
MTGYWSRRRLVATFVAAIAAVPGALLAGGCGGSSNDGGTTGGGGTSGRLEVYMADAPGDPDVTAVEMTITRVEANLNGGWQTISTTPVDVNLLDLAKQEVLVGANTIPAGRYNQVRFFVEDATVTDETGTHELEIPSAERTGIKVNVNYDVEPNAVTGLLLDFNVYKSIVRTGNGRYKLQPVIPAVVRTASGTITGVVVDGVGTPLAGAVVRAIYEQGPAYPVGTEVNVGTSLSDGSFKIWALLPGVYRLDAIYTDPPTGIDRVAIKSGVGVSAPNNTDVGTIVIP